MAGVKGNRRIIYTKQVLKESLIELLQTKEIHQVTVTDLCKRADINRGTFYTHYKDAFDLLECMEDELFSQVTHYINETPVEEYSDSLLLKVLELISENKELSKILFCKQQDHKLLDRLLPVVSHVDFEEICRRHSNQFVHAHIDYFIRYAVGGCISIIQTWLENDTPESPKEIVELIKSIMR